ncbi:MAG: hypothetical protein HUN04_18685 [Desulfobacter sp.]|nr:MAG: hypothetical protein HUN04_18685 [Desulfobacter sp.]
MKPAGFGCTTRGWWTLPGRRRMAQFSDYMNFVQLVHATPCFNINGGVMITPEDIPNDENLYPRMLYAAMTYEKFVTDLEILGRIKHYLKDIETDTGSLAGW